MIYKINYYGKDIEYGPLVESSHFSKDEWNAIYAEIVKQNEPEVFEDKKEDEGFINLMGFSIDLEQRYEALLNLLPQSAYSKAGTHPRWIVEAVEDNTLNKGITQDDVAMSIDQNDTLEGLVSDLKEYFKLDEEYYAERAKFEAKNMNSVQLENEKQEAMKAFDKLVEEEGL